ncbi:Kae1-like domain-containing protein [Azohydromonas caseinilytica]|uniref:Carbamoyltransferase HypF n=1 Tax=Azohydromonas caseinilytica TaxID=2728836 RepID=A0A848FCN8_9BURK|nr:carbamoyltransferase HypF [Azohydromonas caseinilytica]NML15721.1 carbamoyltransferase HypF [Azohydromonas caseinilytica]
MDTCISLPRAAPARVLAVGAWLKNAACRLDGTRALMSPLHGDLDDPAACTALEDSVQRLLALGPVDAIAHDLHPDFHSTRLALALAERLGVPAIGVQHHHAHIAVVQAEQGIHTPLVGLALDGVGLGTDDSPWGGELLLVHGARWRRLGHLQPLALPGGDAAAREPWRLAAAVLHALGRGAEIRTRLGPAVGENAAALVATLLSRGLNCPASSSAGRWFDAAAGLLGLSVRQAAEAEAAIALERLATDTIVALPTLMEALAQPPLPAIQPDGTLALLPLLEGVAAMGDAGQRGEAAALFHVQLADALAHWALQAAHAHGALQLALGGGCFFNRLLGARLLDTLQALGLPPLRPQAVSCGDAGLALGQAWAAALQLAEERRAGRGAASTASPSPTPAAAPAALPETTPAPTTPTETVSCA